MKEGQQSFDPNEISAQQKTFLKQNVENLGFSVRSLKCFKSMGIYTIADLIQRTESELMIRKNFGRKSLDEVISILSELGLCLGTVLPEELNLEIKKSRGKSYPLFEGTAYNIIVPKDIEVKLYKLDFSAIALRSNEQRVLRELHISNLLGLLNEPYHQLMAKVNNGDLVQRIISKAASGIEKVINEYQLECQSLNQWLRYVSSEIIGDGRLKKIIKSKKGFNILKFRYFMHSKEQPLRQIAKTMGMSTEGVRRSCHSSLYNIYKALKLPYRIFIEEFIKEFKMSEMLIPFEEGIEVINTKKFRLFNLLAERLENEIIFDRKALVWRKKGKVLIQKIHGFLEKKLTVCEELSRSKIGSLVIEFILENEFTHFSQPPLLKLFIAHFFKESNGKFFYKKIDRLSICEGIIKRCFPNGIAVYKNIDTLFKKIEESGFSEIFKMTKSTLINLIVSSKNIVLWDWGVYIHKDNIRINEAFLEKIKNWAHDKLIDGVPSLSLNGAFIEFETECKKYGIHNEHALYTCMKLKYENEFSFLNAPYVSPPKTKKRIERLKVVEQHLLKFKKGLDATELQKALGVKEYQINQKIVDSQKILRWSDKKLIHIDNISINDLDLTRINNWIARYINKYGHISVSHVYENNIVLCKKNNIDSPRALYSALSKYFGDTLYLPRFPYIVKMESGGMAEANVSIFTRISRYINDKSDIVSKKELEQHFVNERGYSKHRLESITVHCPDILSYAKDSFVSVKTIGWTEEKAFILEKCAKTRFSKDCITGRPFSYIDDLLDLDATLPSLDEGSIYWQKGLLMDLLEQLDGIRLLGINKGIFVFVPNKDGIETNEDLIYDLLKREFHGAVNKKEFIKRLIELKIASKLNPNNDYGLLAVKGEEVYITKEKC
ncbi:MAG: DNA-directed RNA polymerase subunit alpha C-terminal domain-containing protein [Candidatus Aminicenantes bacterium]